MTRPDSTIDWSSTNEEIVTEVVLDLRNVNPEDLGVELLIAIVNEKGAYRIEEKCELEVVAREGGLTTYRAAMVPATAGFYQVALRAYAKNPLLPHRQDFELVRWL